MLIACLDKEVFRKLAEEENLVIKNGQFIFTNNGELITEIDEEMLIPDQFYWLTKKLINEHPDLFNEIPFPMVCESQPECNLMRYWELHGPISEK